MFKKSYLWLKHFWRKWIYFWTYQFLTNKFFLTLKQISPDLPEENISPSSSPVAGKNSKSLHTGYLAQTSTISEKITSSSKSVINASVTAQRSPLSWTPVASAIVPGPIHIPDPSDRDTPLFPLPPPPLTKVVPRKSKSFKHRKSFEATHCDKPTPFLFCEMNLMNHFFLHIYMVLKLLLLLAPKHLPCYI